MSGPVFALSLARWGRRDTGRASCGLAAFNPILGRGVHIHSVVGGGSSNEKGEGWCVWSWSDRVHNSLPPIVHVYRENGVVNGVVVALEDKELVDPIALSSNLSNISFFLATQ